MISFLLYLDSVDSPNDDISDVISEVIRRAASLNCKSIVLSLSQVEIPTKKRKHLTLKIVNAITNDIQLDSLNELQIIRVITDTKVFKGEFMRNFKLVRKESSADV